MKAKLNRSGWMGEFKGNRAYSLWKHKYDFVTRTGVITYKKDEDIIPLNQLRDAILIEAQGEIPLDVPPEKAKNLDVVFVVRAVKAPKKISYDNGTKTCWEQKVYIEARAA